VASFLPIAP
jgi:hypothetical protein